MKKLIYFFTAVLITVNLTAMATPVLLPASNIDNTLNSADRYLFVEGGIEFSVYPDGEFDFVVPQLINNLHININTGASNISYNSGFNYDAYVQYDNYGAVIQIADVPVFYDNWGRIVQAGNIAINYRNGRIARVGNLQVFYNGNAFAYTRGYIDPYNRSVSHYQYSNYFYRPYVDRCLVYNTPYRRLYTPQRFSYDYHRDHYQAGYDDGYSNAYRNFNRPQGTIAHNNARSGSYRDARNATSRSTRSSSVSSRRTADVGVSRSSRNIENTRSRGFSSIDGNNRVNRSSAVRSDAGRAGSSSLRSSASVPSRNNIVNSNRSSRTTDQASLSSARNTQRTAEPTRLRTQNTARSSRTTNQAARSSSRNTQRTAEPTRSRTQSTAPSASRSSGNGQNNKSTATTSRSSRTSTSRSSRGGGN